jgi:uncharacterized protein (DUF1778 family)
MSRPTRAESPGKPVRVRLSAAEHERAIQAARANHQNLSAFVRDAIVTAASECLEDQPSVMLAAGTKQALRGSGSTIVTVARV